MDRWINRVANIAVVCLAASTLFWWYSSRTPRQVAHGGYRTGDRVMVPGPPTSSKALVIVTRSGCKYCTASFPFYRALPPAVPVVWVAVGESVDVNRRYLQDHGVAPTHVMSLAEAGLTRVSGTPTILLVNQGIVESSWTGLLAADEEREVRTAVGRP